MAITVSEPSVGARPIKMGTMDMQVMQVSALSGATSGTLTATSLPRLAHVILPSGFVQSAAPAISGSTATLAFTVPAETAAARTFQSALTLTAVANLGSGGNSITLTLTAGGAHGAEVVTVVGTAISIQIESTVSTATEIKAAFDLSAAAIALATATLESGHETDALAAATVLPLQNGVTGGAAGFAMCFGRP